MTSMRIRATGRRCFAMISTPVQVSAAEHMKTGRAHAKGQAFGWADRREFAQEAAEPIAATEFSAITRSASRRYNA